MQWAISLFVLAIMLLSGCSGKKEQDKVDLRKLWDFRDPAGTEQRFRALLAQHDEMTEYGLEIKTQIARTMGLRGMFDEGHALLDSVDVALKDDMRAVRIRSLLERGRLLNSAGSPDRAASLFQEAWERSREAGYDNYAIDSAHMMAIVLPPDQQLEWNLKALDLIEKSDDPALQGWKGPLYNNIGWTYFDQGDAETALMYFLKDVNFRTEFGDEDGRRISQWSVARTYRELGRKAEALDLQQKIEKEIEDKKLPADGFVFEELGELHLENGDSETAGRYFASAYKVLKEDQWFRENEKARLERMRKLGNVKE